jgi:D-alanine-D-alanine ligase
MIDEFIPGRELTLGILGSEAFPVLEIVPESGFYDFQAKYTHGVTEYICPAPIDNDLSKSIQCLGLAAHCALGCRDFSRVDFRLRKDDVPFCLEINTIPGMTDTSLLPKAAKVKGINFPDLVESILLMALARNRSEVPQNNILVS